MPKEKDNDKGTTTEVVDNLQDQVNAIAAAGQAEDGVLMAMAKGMTDAIGVLRDVLTMRKGEDEPDGDEGGDEPDGDEDGDEPDADEDGDNDGPGYATMAKADDQLVLDATAWIQDVGTLVHTMAKAMPRMETEISALRAENAKLRELSEQTAVASLGAMTALSKAFAEQHTMLKAIPAGGITPGRDRLQLPIEIGEGEDRAQISRQKLAKAQRIGIIDSRQLQRHLRGDGQFADDDEANQDLLTKIAAL